MPSTAVVLQATPTPGTPLQYLGTVVVTALFFSLTAHLAARYVLGDVPASRALAVGTSLAVVVVALVRFPPVVIIPLAIATDLLAFHLVYRLTYRTAALVTVAHYTVTVLLTFVVTQGLRILSTAPG